MSCFAYFPSTPSDKQVPLVQRVVDLVVQIVQPTKGGPRVLAGGYRGAVWHAHPYGTVFLSRKIDGQWYIRCDRYILITAVEGHELAAE